MIILPNTKSFGRLGEGDSVYLVDPNSGNIVSTQIRNRKEVFKSARGTVISFQIYKIFDTELITPEKLEEAQREYNSKVWWTLRVLGNDIMGLVTLKGVGAPTAISADKEYLERWMKNTGPQRKKSTVTKPH